jgi:hypothetical protein
MADSNEKQNATEMTSLCGVTWFCEQQLAEQLFDEDS